MIRTAVLNVVGLTRSVLGANTPWLAQRAARHDLRTIRPALPAVTCTAQANYLTGQPPSIHGIVGNGWYDRALAEVQFWKQSNHLVQAPQIWDQLRQENPDFRCAQLFWWFNMYNRVDYSITPRPLYPADGRKVFDIYTSPYALRPEIKADLGEFPFPAFWGPAAGVDGPFARDAVSRWIAESARWIERKFEPTLSLVYLPHLDYNLQRLGPEHPSTGRDLRQIDGIVSELAGFYERRGVQLVILSEYGITAVETPICLNRLFRERGWIAIKEELGRELLDAGASRAFAVADHQIAHVYLNDPKLEREARDLLDRTPGIQQVLGRDDKSKAGLDHARAGDLVAVAEEKAWFAYYYWLDDRRAPDFARTVDIHRKPGYDPAELFLDPQQRWIRLTMARKLLQKKLGFRMLMDVVPLDPTLVKGSHGHLPEKAEDRPVLILPQPPVEQPRELDSTEVYEALRRAVSQRGDATQGQTA